MRSRFLLPAVRLLATMALFGWLAASGQLAMIFAQEKTTDVPVVGGRADPTQATAAAGGGLVASSDAPPPPVSPSSRLVSQAKQVAGHLEPAIPRPEQEKAAADKLAAFEKRTGRKPNIVLLLVDDMGWGDCGCYGGGVALGGATPNIDALAAGGLKLTSCYAQPTCTPTRSALLTGRLPVRTGLTRPTLANEKFPVNPWTGEHSLPSLLSQVGYRTALSGKWHIGEGEGMLPHEVGFDEFLGIGSVESYLTVTLPRRTMLTPEIVNDPARINDYLNNGGIFHTIRASKGDGKHWKHWGQSIKHRGRAPHLGEGAYVGKVADRRG